MMGYDYLYSLMEEYRPKWNIPKQIQKALDPINNSKITVWQNALRQLPNILPKSFDLKKSVTVGDHLDIDFASKNELVQTLKSFHPWRKGPFSLFDIFIDTEWRSDWKWDRIKNHISPLKNRLILDVGCGNGYHCWRMSAQEPKCTIGIDPTLLYTMQYQIFAKYLPQIPSFVIPLKMEDLPKNLQIFDSVFSMGILYHRRSPIDHLYNLKSCLRCGGELILETLVIEGEQGKVLVPENRYAKMRNVWFIPTCSTLEAWLKRCGFVNIRKIDVTKTTSLEQRSTDWMTFESLVDFLSPDRSLTIEGYPAPRRATFIANVK